MELWGKLCYYSWKSFLWQVLCPSAKASQRPALWGCLATMWQLGRWRQVSLQGWVPEFGFRTILLSTLFRWLEYLEWCCNPAKNKQTWEGGWGITPRNSSCFCTMGKWNQNKGNGSLYTPSHVTTRTHEHLEFHVRVELMSSHSTFTNPLSCLRFHASKSEFGKTELLFKNPLWPK